MEWFWAGLYATLGYGVGGLVIFAALFIVAFIVLFIRGVTTGKWSL